jgi:hypothetical protein
LKEEWDSAVPLKVYLYHPKERKERKKKHCPAVGI